MSDVDLQKVGLQFQADEHAAQAGAAARVADFQAATAGPPAPTPALTPEQEAAAQQQASQAKAAAFAQAMLPKFCAMVWAVADRMVVQASGSKELAITDEERTQLAEATVPVVDKYLSDSLKWIFTTPEGGLAFVAMCVYGPKLMAMQAASSPSSAAGTAELPPASTPAVPVVTAAGAAA